ncbi:MAG: hypothetical protein KDC34_07200 [Saprospiraceae bacterium]|nr:hypothetical protein [Saprospiraceae bacterium]
METFREMEVLLQRNDLVFRKAREPMVLEHTDWCMLSGSALSQKKSSYRSHLIGKLLQVKYKRGTGGRLEKHFFEIQREALAARFLLFLGARHSAIRLLERVFRKSEQRNDTATALFTAQLLRHHYGVIQRKGEKYRFYKTRASEKLFQYHAEALADEYLEDLLYQYQSGGGSKSALSKIASEYEAELSKLLDKHTTVKLHHRFRFIRVIHQMCLNDYEETAIGCREAIQFFRAIPACPPAYIRAYLFQLIVCEIQLEHFRKGENTVYQLLKMVHPGNSNWFKVLELHCILCLRERNYVQAFEIWQQAASNSSFSRLYASDQEIWRIVEAFLNYLADFDFAGKELSELPPFRLGKFLNEVPTLTQDKRGYNVTILVVQILFLLRKKDYDAIIDRAEAIEKYTDRYLRGLAHRRSRFFLKMILQLPRAGFHSLRVERRVKAWHQKLLATPPAMAREPHEIEIVPYEELWEMVLIDIG